LALLVGGATGRDGIHGATASSTGMTGETLATSRPLPRN
jgi:phosphoribosylformylglycinamidine (FGAM) synthase-like enzyme